MLASVGPVYELPLSGHYFLIKRGEQLIRSRSLWDEDIAMPELGGAVERVQRGDGRPGRRCWCSPRASPMPAAGCR
jgi:hypothetical protein